MSRIPLQLFRCHLVSPHSNLPSWKDSKTREELQSLLSLVFVNMDDGKINDRKKKL